MKKTVFFALGILMSLSASAQNEGPTTKGKFLIEANTGFGSVGSSSNTSFSFFSNENVTVWSLGAEGGFFVADNLALKVGLGYSSTDRDLFGTFSTFAYKLGAKYYVIGKIPFQVDITGQSIEDVDISPLWLGLQGGYAIFLNDTVSIEPGLRYNVNLNSDLDTDGIFELNIGFVVHL